MLSIIEAAGWPIWPLILCSVIALAIIGERLWSLRQNVVLPKNLLVHAIQAYRQNGVTPQVLTQLSATAPLGQILAAGLRNEKRTPAVACARAPCATAATGSSTARRSGAPAPTSATGA